MQLDGAEQATAFPLTHTVVPSGITTKLWLPEDRPRIVKKECGRRHYPPFETRSARLSILKKGL